MVFWTPEISTLGSIYHMIFWTSWYIDPKGHVSFCHHFASVVFSETTKQIWTKLGRNVHWEVLYQICYFGADRKSNMALWKSSCQKLLSRWNCNIIEMMTGWSSTKFVIFVPIAYPRWPPQGNNSLPLDPMWISFKELFLRNYLTNWILCIMWMFLGWFYTWSIILVQIGNPTCLPGPIMCSNWLKLWRSSCQKLLSPWNCNIIEMMTGLSSAKIVIFFADRISKMATTGQLSLPLNPMGISLKNLFVRNYSTNWIFCIIWMFLGWFYTWSIILVQIGNPTWLPGPIMCSEPMEL